MNETPVPLNEVKARFSEFVGRAHDHHERIVVTVHGEPRAVILSAYDYESMRETLDILSDPALVAEIEQGQRDLDEGRTYTLDEVAATVAARSRDAA